MIKYTEDDSLVIGQVLVSLYRGEVVSFDDFSDNVLDYFNDMIESGKIIESDNGYVGSQKFINNVTILKQFTKGTKRNEP